MKNVGVLVHVHMRLKGTKMETYIASIGSKNAFEFTGQLFRLIDTIACKASHYTGVIFPRTWETTSSDITISHCFDFKNSTIFGRFVTTIWIMKGKHIESPKKDHREARSAAELTKQNK